MFGLWDITDIDCPVLINYRTTKRDMIAVANEWTGIQNPAYVFVVSRIGNDLAESMAILKAKKYTVIK